MGPLTYCLEPSYCTGCNPAGTQSFCLTKTMRNADILMKQRRRRRRTTTEMVPIWSPSTTSMEPPPRKLTMERLGSSCYYPEDCLVADSECRNGTCLCQHGFIQRGPFHCRVPNQNLKLGQVCRPNSDTCTTPQSECTQGRCRCVRGFKVGPEDDCIEQSRVGLNGDTCRSSNDCLYDLVCLKTKCTCFTGYQALGKYHCSKSKFQKHNKKN